MKFDLGKIGRVYLIGLFFGLTVLLLVGIGRMALVEYEAPDVFVPWWGYAFWLTVTLVHGLGAWGTLRRKRWAYYLSLVVSMYWIFSSARFLLIGGVNERLVVQVYPWAYALCLVLGAVAFAWLISPRARSELFSVNQKA